jgi:phosphatidylserine/phosphatidylglycerophosphate/cardiolipin synthase-like enzyme
VDLIDSAENTLDIEQLYIYNSSSAIISAIKSANDRGVKVRIIISDDDNSKTFAEYIGSFDNVEIKVCTGKVPMYFQQHNKGIIIDNKTVLISSINWSPTSLEENRETGLIIKSINTTSYYLKLFDHDWSVCVKYNSSEHLKTSTDEGFSAKKSSLNLENDYIEPETFNGTMNMTVMASPDNCYGIVSKLLQQAKKSIDISVYTLSSPYLLDVIRERISHGVKVRLLLEFHPVSYYEQNYNEYAMHNLTVQGVPSTDNPDVINKAQGLWNSDDFTFQHCKYSIIDNETLILSSGNWARSSCPKPQDDGDVDGNRDWWIAIYGGNPSDLILGEDDGLIFRISSYNLMFVVGLIGIISIFITINIIQKNPKI